MKAILGEVILARYAKRARWMTNGKFLQRQHRLLVKSWPEIFTIRRRLVPQPCREYIRFVNF